MPRKPDGDKELSRLKALLFAREADRIGAIEHRLDNPLARAKEMGRTLPEAISLAGKSGDRLSKSLQPVMDNALTVSVKKNPQALADAIFPALGPGIRKAISATIMGMIQSLNHVLNTSFSLRGLKWRFEALKTGRPFAEIVLYHTLIFQVEQIFLIHRDTGIVLEHVVAQNAVIQDPDLVSGMLTAIQDFVKDSFDTETGDELETLRIGSDRSVWIEKGKYAFIAAVITGRPPLELRDDYKTLIDDIHINAGAALEDFDGDPFPFAAFRASLEERLVSREKAEKKRTSPLLWLIFAGLLALGGFWGYERVTSHRLFTAYLDRISAQKGLIVLSAEKQGDEYRLKGLADPLAPSPESLLPPEAEGKIRVRGRWTPFYSLDPEFVLERAGRLLSPPPSVRLGLNGNVLTATGQAPQSWIRAFNEKASALPGILSADSTGLVNPDMEKLKLALADLEQLTLYFEFNSARLARDQEETLEAVVEAVSRIQALQELAGQPVHIVLRGHTDRSGSETLNLNLSRNRAEAVLSRLILRGINPAFITLAGLSTKQPLKTEDTPDNRPFNRAVSFKTFYRAPSESHGTDASGQNGAQGKNGHD